MKIRKGFVSNSSSSSFTCEICNETRSGWDAIPRDIDMRQCANGHVFCDEHALAGADHYYLPEEKKAYLLTYMWGDDKKKVEKLEGPELEQWLYNEGHDVWTEYMYDIGEPERMCPICQFVEPSSSDMAQYLLHLTKISRELVFEVIKLTNRRRKKLYDFEYVTYVCQKENIDLAELMAGLKEKFGTYRNFKEKTK